MIMGIFHLCIGNILLSPSSRCCAVAHKIHVIMAPLVTTQNPMLHVPRLSGWTDLIINIASNNKADYNFPSHSIALNKLHTFDIVRHL